VNAVLWGEGNAVVQDDRQVWFDLGNRVYFYPFKTVLVSTETKNQGLPTAYGFGMVVWSIAINLHFLFLVHKLRPLLAAELESSNKISVVPKTTTLHLRMIAKSQLLESLLTNMSYKSVHVQHLDESNWAGKTDVKKIATVVAHHNLKIQIKIEMISGCVIGFLGSVFRAYDFGKIAHFVCMRACVASNSHPLLLRSRLGIFIS
jgi:hypothetical protein